MTVEKKAHKDFDRCEKDNTCMGRMAHKAES